jgi:2-polyprenyl-6-methoxyphenol hydroxylase-like FAD-dependent oxidoreductase
MDNKHAVVMGASMAGLTAARTLSDHFERVTIIERDQLPSGPEHRRGVPQSRHTHGLLAGGREQLERMYPGLTASAVTAGALSGDIAESCYWVFEGAALAQAPSGMEAILCSRPFIEALVRDRTLALPNVTSRQGDTVSGFVTTSDNARITGVVIDGQPLAADLVVDCTGRGSKTPLWLKELGYDAPVEDRVEIAVRYTTMHFERDPQALDGRFAIVIGPPPDTKRGGVMAAQEKTDQEGGRWTVTLIHHFGEPAPTDVDGFRQWASTLPSAAIYETIRHARPISEASQAQMPASVRRRYENLQRFPEGLLVAGDAICSFNPIYGQGMSVAALDESLREGGPQLGRRFFARAAAVVENPWTIAVGNDLRMPEAVGPRTAIGNLINRYIARLQKAAQRDPVLANAFLRVGNMLAAPPSLLQPKYAWRVFFGPGSRKSGEASVAAPNRATVV